MPHRVLVVEDEPSIVDSLCFIMKQSGFDVRIARDGDTALRMMESAAPDLVLLDVRLPRRDGFEVCRQIRANPAWRQVRILMLSASGREPDRLKGLELGADDYIIKPYSNREVVERVRRALGAPSP